MLSDDNVFFVCEAHPSEQLRTYLDTGSSSNVLITLVIVKTGIR